MPKETTKELIEERARLLAIIARAIDLKDRNQPRAARNVLLAAVAPRDAARPFVNPPGI